MDRLIFFLFPFFPLLAAAVLAGTAPDCHAADVSLNGFLQWNGAADIAGSNPDGGDLKWAEERAQLKLAVSAEPYGNLLVKPDLFHDEIDGDVDIEIREAYIDHVSTAWDIRAGRQVLTWGLGDLVFINDVFPKDYEAFFSGRPLEYLKKGVDGVKLGLYPEIASFELVIVPFFEPNNFPSPERFHMFDPMAGFADRDEEKPPVTAGNTEIALRAYRSVGDLDASIYLYRGFSRQPSVMPDNPAAPTRLILFYPELTVYGASLQGKVWDGVYSLEAGYYDSREDRDGADPMIPNSQMKFLAGYQLQPWEDFSLAVQYYGELMDDYPAYKENLPAGFPREEKLHELVSIRLTQFLLHQTLRLSWFSFYSPSEGDHLVNPEVKYNLTDNVWAAVGAMVFGGGAASSQLGQLDKNDNVYLQCRYEF